MPEVKSVKIWMKGIGVFAILVGVLIAGYHFNHEEKSMNHTPERKGVLVYSKSTCPYCVAAKRLLNSKGVTFEEIDINHHPDRREEMIEKANGRSTVPQIFIGDMHVGGFTDLQGLEQNGKLDKILAN